MRLNNSQLNLLNLRPLLTVLAITWLLASLGLGWLVNSLVILFGLLMLAPVVAFFGLRWWLERNLITDKCPICDYEFTALNNSQMQCPNCGELLTVQKGHFQRLAPEGTIDVTAIEVPTQQLED